jgi:hypothetical protein
MMWLVTRISGQSLDGVRYDSVFYDPEGRIVGTLPTRTYQITVVAVDKDGNRSAPSAPLAASGRDTTPPDPISEVGVVERTATSATIATRSSRSGCTPAMRPAIAHSMPLGR